MRVKIRRSPRPSPPAHRNPDLLPMDDMIPLHPARAAGFGE